MSAAHVCSLVHHVGAFGQRGVRAQPVSALLNGNALTGERRLINLQVLLVDESGVGRDNVPLTEHDNIAGHEIGRIDVLFGSVSSDRHTRSSHLPEGLKTPLGAILLNESEDAVRQQDSTDENGINDVSDQYRKDSGDQQDPDESTRELCEENPQWSTPPITRELVRSDGLTAFVSRIGVKSRCCCIECVTDVRGGAGMPVHDSTITGSRHIAQVLSAVGRSYRQQWAGSSYIRVRTLFDAQRDRCADGNLWL